MPPTRSTRPLHAGVLAAVTLLLACGTGPAPAPPPAPAGTPAPAQPRTPTPPTTAALSTPAEASGWQAISSHAQITTFYRELQVRSPEVRMLHLGTSREGRELVTVTLARPAVTSPAEAHASGKPILFIGAQVHGDEPAGMEGLMLFARELALGSLRPLLDDLIFVFVPQINPDAGEAGSWGTRTNPSGYNMNRDYARLDNPEIRAFVNRGLVRWEPHVIVDAHEAQGPPRYYDFYTSYPRNHGAPQLQALLEAEVVPALVQALQAAGFNHYFYHTVPGGIADVVRQSGALERADGAAGTDGMLELPARLQDAIPAITFGGGGTRSLSSYGGPHGAITLLYESLRRRDARIGLERRARMQYVAMEGLARYVAENRSKVLATVAEAREHVIARGAVWDEADSIPVTWESYVTRNQPYTIVVDDRPVQVSIPIRDGRRPDRMRVRPVGYLIESHRGDVAEHLALHGVVVERLLEPATVEVESFRVDSVTYSGPSEGIIPRDFTVTLQPQTLEVPTGTWIARAAQRRAGLLFHWMEPEDADSYAAGGWFINHEGEGNLFPVHRLRALPAVPMQVRGAEDFR